jgi:uncharacterized protein
MSVTPTYPGIYIQEVPSSSHAIVPAPTSVAAFVGYSHPFKTKTFNVAQRLFSFSDYEANFGPLFSSGLIDASLPRAVYQFFLNGGSTAYVVGLQPGLFDDTNAIVTRFGAANGGATISATATTTSGGTSAAVAFAVGGSNPLPAVSSLSPASIATGSADSLLSVSGSNFVASSVVNWDGAPLATTYVNASQLTALVPASDVAAAATANVTVSNPAPGGGDSAAATFTVGANPLPTISSLSPAGVAPGSATFTLTIDGSNFVPLSVVNWNGAQLTATYVNGSRLMASVPASDVAAAGTANLTVSNPAPGGGDSAVASFAIGANPLPTISSLSPGSIIPGSAAFTLTVDGGNFVPASVVNWNGAPLTTTYVNGSQLTASVPASDVAAAGTASVAVSNPTPGGGNSAAASFAIGANPLPAISSVSPAGVAPGSASFTLTVNGSGFVSGSVVNWNGAPLTTTYVSGSRLTASVPTSAVTAAGTASVTVSSPASAATSTGIVFTARELTDIVAMQVAITNVRAGGATFDVTVTYGSQVETFRGVQLAGAVAQLPDKLIGGVSTLVQVNAAAGGWGAAIANQQISLTYAVPSQVSTGFSASDFTVGDGSTIAVFEPNSSLDNLEIFNLLLVPGVTDFSVISAALAFAERKRAFMILDPPPQAPAFGASSDSPQPIQYWMEGLGGTGPSLPRSQNGAIYFPYLISTDLVTGNNTPMAPSGFVAGIYAQTDADRGVWKAPAGLAAVVENTAGPVASGAMNDPQQGVLNLDSINCLRTFAGIGTVVWGARTLVASNTAFQQSMYVPVRRMTLFIEQTLLANLRWVVFEPNDEPLWTAIRTSIEGFLLSLFRQGALQGKAPSEAFQVKCDATTTTPEDQQNGIVNIVVAFAPLKPAEFVIIKIAQIAGQTAGT